MIHYAGEPFSRGTGTVVRTDLATFARGGNVEVVAYRQTCAAPDIVLRRAESRLGEEGYDLFGNNCEHFARWCKTGQHESRQVRRFLRAVGAVCLATGTLVLGVAVPYVMRHRGSGRSRGRV